jgi:serine/threonine protein kinase
LYLIKEEIAIMKKLNHPNLVSLIEVLDDPEEDSLYMVLEMCKKGVVMKVGLNEKADPYDAESCRCWFRDLILGIEYCKPHLAPCPLRAKVYKYMHRELFIETSSQTIYF